MKKRLFFVVFLLIIGVITNVCSADEIAIVVDGNYVDFNIEMGIPFIDKNNRTLVPLRAVLEEFNAVVAWDNEVKAAVVEKDGTIVVVSIGKDSYWVDGVEKKLDTKAVIKNGRTYIPIRAVIESLGGTVIWDDSIKAVSIISEDNLISKEEKKFKIGIFTGDAGYNEEEFRAAQSVKEKYGEDRVITMTYSSRFIYEEETTIARLVSMALDPDLKALIICQAVPGTTDAIDRIKEFRNDLLIIAAVTIEDIETISEKADLILNINELEMGKSVPKQAKTQGAKVFVHYSFPRHMSYPLLSARRDLMKETCTKLGIEFVDSSAPDPFGNAGVAGAQQYILEDVPRMVEKYGKDTAFFSTNCSLQIPLIRASLHEGAIYPQSCCPSPYHGFITGLSLEIPDERKGDIDFAIGQISNKIAEKGGTGRFSTWPVSAPMMFIEAGADYAMAWGNGEFTEKVNRDVLVEKFENYAGANVDLSHLIVDGKKYENCFLVLIDYLNF